jgi:hypothetical protein
MISANQLQKWQKGISTRFPIMARFRRQRAVAALEAHRNEPQVVPLLVEAFCSSDAKVGNRAAAALADLTAQEAIDVLGALWAKGRNRQLGEIIVRRGYIAKQPLQIMILTGLKCGKRVKLDRADIVPIVLGLLTDADETVRLAAMRSIEQVAVGVAQDALCNEAIKNPSGPAAQICIRTGKKPSDRERLCLFLFVTRQLDEYFKEDFEFQNLKLQYDRADPAVRGHVMEVVRSGDRRCAGFFGTRSKPVTECTEAEIELAMDSWLRHKEWARLFQACLELPLKWSFPALAPLRQSRWEPDAADLRSVFRQILADAGDQALPPAKQPPASSSVFEQWLARGASGELAQLDEAALCERLKTATPPDGVAIVGAMAGKKSLSTATVKAVQENPHWLVRLAGHAAGIYAPDLAQDSIQDPNYWVTELASAKGILDFWPGKATPADLERLSAAPPEAWAGKLGSARKVLRTVMTHRITTGTFEPMVIEAGEFAGEFVNASGEGLGGDSDFPQKPVRQSDSI